MKDFWFYALAREWVRIQAEARAAGAPVSVQDGWIAATACYFDLPLLSHDRKHFEGVKGIRLLTSEANE